MQQHFTNAPFCVRLTSGSWGNQQKGESPPESIVQPVSEEPDDGNKDESPYDSPEDDISHLSGSIYM